MKFIVTETRLESNLVRLEDGKCQIAISVSVQDQKGHWVTVVATPTRGQARQLRRELGELLNGAPMVSAWRAP